MEHVIINIQLTKEQFSIIRQAAEIENISISEFMINAALAATDNPNQK